MSEDHTPTADRNTCWEIRDSDLAVRFVLEGLLIQSVSPPTAGRVPETLAWVLEAVVEGVPLPPIGVLADIGHLALGQEYRDAQHAEAVDADKVLSRRALLPAGLTRQYEDLFLGKLYSDRSFERGLDGLRRYRDPRDRAKGLAFLLQQLGRRLGCGGVVLSPGVIRDLQRKDAADLLALARANWRAHGPIRKDDLAETDTDLTALTRQPFLESLYRNLIAGAREVGDTLGPEDVFELEQGTALAGFGQRIALRQVLQAAAELESRVPQQPPRPRVRHRQVATQIVDEDTYPIGGFSSLSNRGSIESLLHSQLAFMEKDERPDMFDIKFLRDELLYYSRDENQFLRRRRSFVFAFCPDLTAARIKDAELPWQRIVMLLGLLRVAILRLTDWLSEEALCFEFAFIQEQQTNDASHQSLTQERELLEMLFREQIANQSIRVSTVANGKDFQEHCEKLARRSLCHAATVSVAGQPLEMEHAIPSRFQLDQAMPSLFLDSPKRIEIADGSALENWSQVLIQFLEHCLAE